eukprot:6482993-Amphidinium_carterae.1
MSQLTVIRTEPAINILDLLSLWFPSQMPPKGPYWRTKDRLRMPSCINASKLEGLVCKRTVTISIRAGVGRLPLSRAPLPTSSWASLFFWIFSHGDSKASAAGAPGTLQGVGTALGASAGNFCSLPQRYEQAETKHSRGITPHALKRRQGVNSMIQQGGWVRCTSSRFRAFRLLLQQMVAKTAARRGRENYKRLAMPSNLCICSSRNPPNHTAIGMDNLC